MALCDKNNRFLYEVRPDLLPPFLTDIELHLWAKRFAERKPAGKG